MTAHRQRQAIRAVDVFEADDALHCLVALLVELKELSSRKTAQELRLHINNGIIVAV